MNKTDLLLVHHADYANWAFSQTHPTQGRRFLNAMSMTVELAKEHNLSLDIARARKATKDELELAHLSDYIVQVQDYGECNEWEGPRQDLGAIATLMAGGTMVALEELKAGSTLTAVNFAGAKHHAQWQSSSGFCVFADFVMASKHAWLEWGWKTLIIDIDAHHGDGTENGTYLDENTMSWSIHEAGIFPGTGNVSAPHYQVYNIPLLALSGDTELLKAIRHGIKNEFKNFNPDLILIAGGADGHMTDPLSTLQYSVEGIELAMREIRQAFKGTPILFGGAGGYQPDTFTPAIWSRAVVGLAEGIKTPEIHGNELSAR